MVLTALFPGVAVATCDETYAVTSDKDLWQMHDCSDSLVKQLTQAYNMRSGDWSAQGWSDQCNLNKEFAKTLNAMWLVSYGINDDAQQSFHGAIDYQQLSQAGGNDYKDKTYYHPSDATSFSGEFVTHFFGDNEIRLACPLFADATIDPLSDNPIFRASDLMHESWHGWEAKYGWFGGSEGGHYDCTTGSDGGCRNGNCTVHGCDYFYFHSAGSFKFGYLYTMDLPASERPSAFNLPMPAADPSIKALHSPNQIQVEFLCDIVLHPQSWMPMSVVDLASMEANARGSMRFINGPAMLCGNPSPGP
jgi:hypothetical protein